MMRVQFVKVVSRKIHSRSMQLEKAKAKEQTSNVGIVMDVDMSLEIVPNP